MNLLDENIRDDQRMFLRQWHIPFRQIGKEISRAGVDDEEIVPLLHRLKRPTLFTQDEDFLRLNAAGVQHSALHVKAGLEKWRCIDRCRRGSRGCERGFSFGLVGESMVYS